MSLLMIPQDQLEFPSPRQSQSLNTQTDARRAIKPLTSVSVTPHLSSLQCFTFKCGWDSSAPGPLRVTEAEASAHPISCALRPRPTHEPPASFWESKRLRESPRSPSLSTSVTNAAVTNYYEPLIPSLPVPPNHKEAMRRCPSMIFKLFLSQ